jgi:hypothetical protein
MVLRNQRKAHCKIIAARSLIFFGEDRRLAGAKEPNYGDIPRITVGS